MSLRHPPSQPPASTPRPAAEPDWGVVRSRARTLPPAAFAFVREGLAYTLQKRAEARAVVPPPESDDALIAVPPATLSNRHLSGQELCIGLRDLARERYGPLARTVFATWGVRSTQDFGYIVYAMIDRQEMKTSAGDRFDDFYAQYDFADAFK